MPWRRMDVSEQRMQFVIRAQSKQERLSALCREFGNTQNSHGRIISRAM